MKSTFLFLSLSVALSASTFGAPLTLQEAIQRALRENQAITVRALGRDVAAGERTAARGLFDPRLQFERSQAKSEVPLAVGAAPNDRWQDDYSVNVSGLTPWGVRYELGGVAATQRTPSQPGSANTGSQAYFALTQPLLRGLNGQLALQGVRIAKANQSIADWEFKQTALDTVTAVVVAFHDVLEARESLRISIRYRNDVRSLATGHQRRLEIGSLAEADVANAQSRAAQIEESVLYAEQNARDTEQRLRRLFGESRFENVAPLELDAPPYSTFASPEVASDLPRALAHRPDLQAARLGIKKAEILRAAAKHNLLPTVDLVASYGYGDVDTTFSGSRRAVLDREHRLYSAGLVVSVPLTLTEARGQHRAARAQLRQREVEAASFEADIALALDRTARAIRTAAARVKSLEEAQTLAKRSVDAEEKRFRAGTGNTFFVLQQQGELASVELALTRARHDLERAQVRYLRETGEVLERFGVNVD